MKSYKDYLESSFSLREKSLKESDDESFTPLEKQVREAIIGHLHHPTLYKKIEELARAHGHESPEKLADHVIDNTHSALTGNSIAKRPVKWILANWD